MEILAEAALEGSFSLDAERSLIAQYEELTESVKNRISEVEDVLIHDGYLEKEDDGLRFSSNLLKDWWATRFRDHHIGLRKRNARKSR